MPLGPLQLTDETSLDLGAKIARATKAAMGDAYDDGADDIIFTMVEQGRWAANPRPGSTPMTTRASAWACGRVCRTSPPWPRHSPT
jgi:3-hydroxyacyl-CoA dehydrogenase